MNIASLSNRELSPAVGSDIQGRAGLSALQREWAHHFVLQGGNGLKAAILAGYSPASAHVSASKNLHNPTVMAEVKRLSVVNVSAYLPIAIQVLVEIACNPDCDPRARVQAANSLLDRGGMSAPKGGVQVNVGVQVNGNEVQTLIGSIWDAREGRTSRIAGGMSDNAEPIVTAPQPALIEAAPTPLEVGRGGVQDPGSHARVPLIPPHSTANPPKSAGVPASHHLFTQSRTTAEEILDEEVGPEKSRGTLARADAAGAVGGEHRARESGSAADAWRRARVGSASSSSPDD